MERHLTVRTARADDAAACAAVYAPFVTDGVASFEYQAPSAEEMGRRMRAAHDWVVAERAGGVAGYAYASPHHPRAGYRWTADVAVYVATHHHRAGVGRALYSVLIERMRAAGFRMLCAGITLPNPGSTGLHESLGFAPVGVYRDVGWKNGAWHDVAWYQLDLAPGAGPPPGA